METNESRWRGPVTGAADGGTGQTRCRARSRLRLRVSPDVIPTRRRHADPECGEELPARRLRRTIQVAGQAGAGPSRQRASPRFPFAARPGRPIPAELWTRRWPPPSVRHSPEKGTFDRFRSRAPTRLTLPESLRPVDGRSRCVWCALAGWQDLPAADIREMATPDRSAEPVRSGHPGATAIVGFPLGSHILLHIGHKPTRPGGPGT